MPAIDIDRNAAHQAAQRELAKLIYPRASPSQQFHDWLNELLNRLLQTGASVTGGWFSVTVVLLVLGLAVAAAIQVARRTMRTSRETRDYPLFDAGQQSASQHRATAEQYAAQGNWAAAIRHRLRAVARQLEETGVLDPVPGRTAGELAHDAGIRLPHLASELTQSATVFNDVTYGDEPGSPAGYRIVSDLDDHLRSRPSADRGEAARPAAVEPWAQVR